MARLPRFILPGHPQHVIQRGNNREPTFCQESDYQFYLEKLAALCLQHQCDLHAYVLMTNHVHLLLTPHTGEGISKVMQGLGRYYVQYFNYTYQRTGTLWEGRYRATLLDSEQYLLTCMRYIELNPVRACMVSHPQEYPWSSYRLNATGVGNEIIKSHSIYGLLGKGAEERQIRYRALFQHEISETVLEGLRDSTNKSWVLGSDRFKDQIKERLNRQLAPKVRGGDRKSHKYFEANKFNRV